MVNHSDDDWFTSKETAAEIRKSVNHLEVMRTQGLGPKWFKPEGSRRVYYRWGDIVEWKAQQAARARVSA